MLSIRLDKDTEKRLTSLARRTGRSKSFYARKALQEYIEDREDYLRAVHALEHDNGKYYTLEQVMKKYNVRPRKKPARKA